MRCENQFCIYWEEDICILDEISLDIQGSCQSCIYVEISKAFLEQERQTVLRRLQEDCEETKSERRF